MALINNVDIVKVSLIVRFLPRVALRITQVGLRGCMGGLFMSYLCYS